MLIDHAAVLFGIPAPKPLSENKTTKCRRWKSLDLDAFKSDLSTSDIHSILESNSMSDAVRTYDTILHNLIDKHAPEYDRTFKSRHNTPWYNSTVRDAKRLRRKLERRWRKTRSEPDREAYRYQCQVVRDELVKAKSEHYHNKLSEADNHKDVYSIANSLLFGPKVQKLPTHDSVQDLSEQFADYFIQKIVTIRNGLCQNINSDNQCDETDVISILGSLNPATNEEISKIIRSSASKSCDLDPIPTWLLKLCLSELLPVITYIVNLSLSTSTVPYELKLALITPLLKKVLLDPEVLKTFRPVSNLTYLSKIIERVVVVRLNQHLTKNGLHEVLQSAYKQNHSTETALLKVQNDLLMAIDTYGEAVLILLDLSAAFDTIDHTILLQRLHELGIRDAALDWFKSYLSQRRQSVVINGTRSSHRNMSFGVPQGSVLGPILFTLYTTPLGAIARKYQLNFHLYADDTQLYMSFKPNHAESLPLVISNIQNCVTDIKSWMTANMLQLNMDKTEVLVLMNKSLRNPITMNKIKIDSIDISTASSVRNLGVIFDTALSSEAFVNSICKSAWFNLFNISKSRRSLTTDAAKILIQAYVMSKIDYCNSLLYGIPDKLLNRIQRIQNYAARVVLRLHKFSHITPALATLHWLPVKRRIDFKIALLVYKALNGQAPAYIADLLQPYDPPRKLRSADKQLLSQPPCRLKSYGDRAFCCAAPFVWNNIPHSVKTAKTVDNFKVKLKTHFYSVSFA